ncbi:MAG TPA: hypothetical protein VFW33_09945 [Gemmataceae bacterium]|nr:hypothetical protein [Gemmataceae bacterium]
MGRDEILKAFLRGRSRWAGCDWPTRFGATGLNLCTLTAAQALLMARATAGAESAEWRAAAVWLSEVEAAARAAEQEASRAARLAAEGQFAEAAERARRALDLESRYRPPVVWRPLHDAISRALPVAVA